MRRRDEWGHVWWVLGVAGVLGAMAFALPRSGGPAKAAASEKPHAGHGDATTRRMLEKVADYRGWDRFATDAEKAGGRDAYGHGSAWTVRYFNDTARAALRDGAWKFPAGSAFVTEDKSAPDGPPSQLTAMIKQPDGQWYWVAYTPAGRVIKEKGGPAAGRVGRCIVCHSQTAHDMVLNPVVSRLASGASNG